ncbi:hypothetical protein JRO89_XS11G0121900 [Xanthoceras sorbifolium]|uniref:AtC3H23-like CCCH zinc finger domain-containing protein n=1 Tax=Xanthoceras sorbifolium TaxID=99658 RepID=A0ABQ8HFD4_9ROSI|nr:hypothetical protein JRO89_XS11G0121900 [Xanthoceras sorbifolium]
MLKGVNNFKFYNFGEVPFSGVNLTAKRYNDAIDEEIYGSDEFRMFGYKIKRCPRTRSHDWTDCPYAHRGEKAQRATPAWCHTPPSPVRGFDSGNATGATPASSLTASSSTGSTQPGTVHAYAMRAIYVNGRMGGGDHQHQYYQNQQNQDLMESWSSGGHGESVSATASATSGMATESPSSVPAGWPEYRYDYEEVEEVLKSMRVLQISDNGGGGETEQVKRSSDADAGGIAVSDLDLLHIAWISDLVQ